MKLVLVRHAQTAANAEGRLQGRADFDLSQEGLEQSALLRDRLFKESYEPTHFYVSPLKRTLQTAEIIGESWVVKPKHWKDLMEYDVGIVSGLTWDEIAFSHPEIDIDLEKTRQLEGVEGAESLLDRRKRATRVIEHIFNKQEQADSILLVSHGGFMQHMISVLMGSTYTWGIQIGNTAIFEFSIDKQRWNRLETKYQHSASFFKIDRFNDSTHIGKPSLLSGDMN